MKAVGAESADATQALGACDSTSRGSGLGFKVSGFRSIGGLDWALVTEHSFSQNSAGVDSR